MKQRVVHVAACTALGFAAGWTTPVVAATTCTPLDLSADELPAWRADGFATVQPDSAALQLLDCLGNPDPFLRDQVGYEGLTTLLRGERVSAGARRQMIARLTAMLARGDGAGFEAPFAALALAEVARTDRIGAFLDSRERDELVNTAASYLSGVDDYRGFVDGEGWRHGVAHGADLVLQLVLNPAVSAQQERTLLEAVAVQIAPGVGQAYIFGEPGRLARPVLYAAYNGRLDEDFWSGWFAALGDPAPLESWGQAFGSERDLVRLHNLRGFARAVYTGAAMSGEEVLRPLVDRAQSLLQILP